jgi:hypothetical protein
MKGYTYIFFILLFTLSLSGFSQSIFRVGVDAGISITSRQNVFIGKLPRLLSPQVGISGLLNFPSHHVQLILGIQYEKVGYREGGTYPNENVFNKLSIPFTTGIILGNSKIKPVVFIGYRPNILLSGTYQESGVKSNPFNDEYPPKRYTNQFITGFSTYFGNNLVLNLSYCVGQSIEFGNSIMTYSHKPGDQGTTTIYWNQIKNNEFSISLTYLFKSNKTTN